MKSSRFHKVLVVNRGEIALRLIRAIREMDMVAVVLFAEPDRDLPFVIESDEAYSLGKGTVDGTYLNMEKILERAKFAGVDALHPGYGFLSENARFAGMCQENGIRFIGPPAQVIDLMGNKSNARRKAMECGVPVVEGITGSLDQLIRKADSLPYPVLIKPSAGGGGKGMRIVTSRKEFQKAAEEALREADAYFGSGELYVERYMEESRHIEVQIMADMHGHVVHLFERECTLQRRYQKIIEEAPSPSLSAEDRERITSIAVGLAREIGYINAGTVEFLVENGKDFHFLEMNTRIQVEHPVTEMITGIDIVKEQIRVAQGEPLSFSQENLSIYGHSMEARIYAEDPWKEFLPSSGRIEVLEFPEFEGVRIDSGFRDGNLVEPYYDPMLAKVIVSARSREEARNQLIGALKEIRIVGLMSNRDFLVEVLRSKNFSRNRIHTRWIEMELKNIHKEYQLRAETLDSDHLIVSAVVVALQNRTERMDPDTSPWKTIGHWRLLPEITLQYSNLAQRIKYELLKGREKMILHLDEREFEVAMERREGHLFWIRINHQIIKVWGMTDRSEIMLDLDGHLFRIRRLDILDRRFIHMDGEDTGASPDRIVAPLNGRIVQVNVKSGDLVSEGDPLLIIESMKMENKILASHRASVGQLYVSAGEQVQTNQLLLTFATK